MPIYEKLMGNPFVDAGICGICEWLGRSVQPEQITTADLEKVVNDVAPMMQTDAGWGNLHSLFPNSVLTNAAYSKCNRVELLKKVCQKYLDTIQEMDQTGDCMGCGRRYANEQPYYIRDLHANCMKCDNKKDPKPFLLSKSHVPLTGSGALRNFFPIFTEGAPYCSACALAIQLCPLTLVASGEKFLTLHSNSWRALRSWARICVSEVRQQELQQDITGCYNPGFVDPRNGLFYMARKMVQFQEMHTDESIAMQVYYFTNYGQEPKLEILYMPESVFTFLRVVYQSEFKAAWLEIVRSGYKKVKWDRVQSEEDYKNNPNSVYENLLQNRSILGFFLNRRARKPRGNWELLSLYLKEVREMSDLRLNALKRVGDFVAESIEKTNKVGRLRDLERARGYPECRNILRYVIRDRIRQGEDEPLFSLDDYVKHLFPEPSDHRTYWSETRDLLVFRIYEKLHGWLVANDAVDEEDDESDQITDGSQEGI
ncbi:MAG: type I-B CRISPR-associated protein Cas8b1/Cst1 [Candidatus Poribacteria bacterium]|nr:type I-B CRISPR-associated protein Cas8b1/Cst1 [Candidatus Poribacteria bacterium]